MHSISVVERLNLYMIYNDIEWNLHIYIYLFLSVLIAHYLVNPHIYIYIKSFVKQCI